MFHGYGSVATHSHTLHTLPASARTSPTPPPPARTCPHYPNRVPACPHLPTHLGSPAPADRFFPADDFFSDSTPNARKDPSLQAEAGAGSTGCRSH